MEWFELKEVFGTKLKMLVVGGINKMFGKKENKEMKIVEKDVGFAEDSFELMKQAVGEEAHHIGNFVISKSKEDLVKLNNCREVRSKIQNLIIETTGAKIDNQCWCILKHVCGEAMHTHELINRASSIGADKLATELSKIHKKLYLSYLEVLGFTEENISNESSA